MTVVTLVGVESHFGLGHKHKDIPVRFQDIAIKCSYFTIIFYQACLRTTKLGILFFYLRILTLRLHRILIFCTIALVSTYGAILLPLSALLCNPLTHRFPFSSPHPPKCLPYYPLMTTSAILHTSTDIWLLILIAPQIIHLSLPRRQKLALTFLLTLGLFGAYASLTRLSVAYRFLNRSLAQWDSFSFAIWTTLETSLGIICASAPMLRPMVRLLMGQNPISGPDARDANVPRSGGVRKVVRNGEESLWTARGTGREESVHEHEHEQQKEQEMQMRDAVQAAGKDFLAVNVMRTGAEGESERSASVSTPRGSIENTASMV